LQPAALQRQVAFAHVACESNWDHCSIMVPPSGVETIPRGGGVSPCCRKVSVRYCAKYQHVAGASSNCVSLSSSRIHV